MSDAEPTKSILKDHPELKAKIVELKDAVVAFEKHAVSVAEDKIGDAVDAVKTATAALLARIKG